MYLRRKNIIQRAYDECMTEMYAKAQPSADYMQMVQDIRDGKLVEDKNYPIYNQHYLSQKEFEYIRQKYIDAYRLNNNWKDNVEFIRDLFINGGMKDKWIERDGDNPGYRSAEDVPPMKDIIGEEATNKLLQVFNDMTSFYRFDREEDDFNCSVALGCSPTSDAKTVIEYWKSKGVDIQIEERDPETFWYRDEFGDKWKEIWNEEHEEIN